MDLFDAIRQRHSYRGGFAPRPVPRAELTRIIEAGLLAPSGCNAQTTRFVVVDAPPQLAAVRAIMDRPVVASAPAVIVCVAEHRPVYNGMSFAVEDCAAAVENMLLAITALGLASVWLDGVLRTGDRARRIADSLGIPAGQEVRVLLPVGYPAEPVEGPGRKPFAERAAFNAWPQP